MNDDQIDLEKLVLTVIEDAAEKGERCPNNWTIAERVNAAIGRRVRSGGSIPAIIQKLVRQGHVKVSLYGRNYRQIEICSGRLRGRKTLAPSHAQKPYVVIDRVERLRRDADPAWPT